jgi:hypothetical protein
MQRRRVVPLPATVVCTNVRRHLPVVLCCGWCSAGATGISISQSVALISAIDARRNSKDDLAKVALHLVIKSIMEPDALVPMTDGTSPNTVVDTPQPQTPFSPATPDSLPVVKKSNPTDDDAATTALRHDASIALIGTLISRGLLLWEVVQRRLGMDLKKFTNSAVSVEKRHVVPMLGFVELLLTEKRRAAAAIMTQMDWQRLSCMRRTQPPNSTNSNSLKAYKILVMMAEIVQSCDKAPIQHAVVSSMQQILQDDAMCRIATSDDPATFYANCFRPSTSLLRVAKIEKNPFRYFSFGAASERKSDILSTVQTLISRVGSSSMSFECLELRVLSETWKDLHDEVGESYTEDGWMVWKLANEKEMALFDRQLSDDTRAALKKALKRDKTLWFEHYIAEMLLAEIWRAPQKIEHLMQFAKAMSLQFRDRFTGESAGAGGLGGWFETQLLQVIFALLDCEPIKRGSIALDVCFRCFIYPAVSKASKATGGQEPEQMPGHRVAFEAALVHIVERYGVQHRQPLLQDQRDSEKLHAALMKGRRQYTTHILAQIEALVTLVQARDFDAEVLGRNDAGKCDEPDVFAQRPTLHSLQKACLQRLQLLNAALMHLPDDDHLLTSDMLQSAISAAKKVCSCAHLMSQGLGDTLFPAALASVDKVGSLTTSIDWLRDRRPPWLPQCVEKFKTQLRQELLKEKLPRFVSDIVCSHLPVTDVRLTSSGVARHAPAAPPPPPADPHQSGQAPSQPAEPGATFEDDEAFLMDPWLLFEHNPKGVLRGKLAFAKRRPRKKLKWELAPQAPPPGAAASGYAHLPHAASGVGGTGVAGAAGQYGMPPAGHYHPHPPHAGTLGEGGWG